MDKPIKIQREMWHSKLWTSSSTSHFWASVAGNTQCDVPLRIFNIFLFKYVVLNWNSQTQHYLWYASFMLQRMNPPSSTLHPEIKSLCIKPCFDFRLWHALSYSLPSRESGKLCWSIYCILLVHHFVVNTFRLYLLRGMESHQLLSMSFNVTWDILVFAVAS